jgi:endonuclease YncB( thermonuclease family)
MKLATILISALIALPAVAGPVRVIDGDTLDLDGERIRLWGIDAPERNQTCEIDGATAPIGAVAADRLRQLLARDVPDCRAVERDRYGRTVARCAIDGQDIGSLMVLSGLAWDYQRFSGGFYAAEQDAAQRGRRGLWAGDCAPAWVWRRR